MLGKIDTRSRPETRPRDGRHCDLCGCSQPAVRCDKCGCQIFCLSCDDMYHRHPKRRFHLRKAVDPIPIVPQARPVLPVKVAHLSTSPGDPSKMPLPPPRKKKSIFGSFKRPSGDNSPPLPKKEYSWSDRLGSIKKFMSNRPLPPLPTGEDNDMELQSATNGQTAARGDLSFIHRRNDERPPQLPQRSPKAQESPGIPQERDNRIQNPSVTLTGQIRNGIIESNANHMHQNREFSINDDNQWNNRMNNQDGPQAFGTINRQNHHRGFMHPGSPGYPGGMHQSSSATDLHKLHNAEAAHGAAPVPPHYPPHYPMNPHMPPHYPYPMYPQFPNYPQYFGNSFANLANPPTTDGDVSDEGESQPRHSSKKHPFRKRAKRSQSVMVDRMAYPGQFYPFGPFPGYGPWGPPMPMEAPPSPASSIRSLNRTGRSRRRKKATSEDDDEELSASSSPLSRPKSSSSDPKDLQRAPLATQTTSSDEESYEDANDRRNKANTIQRRQSEPNRKTSPTMETKKTPKLQRSSKQSDSETLETPQIENKRTESKDSIPDQPIEQQSPPPSIPSDAWECKHCTFINPSENKICQVCCKTATLRTETPILGGSRPPSAVDRNRKQSVDSEKGCSSPEKIPDNEEREKKDKQDMAILNSALDEAEKEISRGLEELMKLKDDMDISMSKENNRPIETESKIDKEETSKPVYKSSGRMRTSILDKLNLNKPQTSKSSASTSTETQTGQSNWISDKVIEARRLSNSSASDAYNSPLAQSPELERSFLGNKQKRDSSCQTQQDSLEEYLERKKAAEEAFLGRPINNFGFGYGDRMDMMSSPLPPMYDRFFGGGYGMVRSHSRASLFTGRLNDPGPMDYGGYGYGPTPMYRSISRGSLTGDYPDNRLSEFQNLRRPDFYLSMEELVERRRQETMRAQGLELVRMIREAEQQGFNADDIQVALTHCGKQNPLEWLQDNWRNMVDSVVTLSTNYGNDKKENDIGLLSENEARDALRLHKGNIWAAITECVEGRQRKYLELSARGKFPRKEIVDALTASEGDVEMAYAKLSKTVDKPFLMRIWGAGEGAQNQDGAQPLPEDLQEVQHRYQKDETLNSDELSEDLWSDDGVGVEWEEDDEYDEERGEPEDLQTCREDLPTDPQELRTPESEKSDYCDAFAVEDRNVSSPSDDIFFVIPETKQEKKKGFLSKLAALRKDNKEQVNTTPNISKDEPPSEQSIQSREDPVPQTTTTNSEQSKNNGAFSALKNTLSAIKDTVTGSNKNDKKVPSSQLERRTIIVRGQIDHESLSNESNDNVKQKLVKLLDHTSLKQVNENEQYEMRNSANIMESEKHDSNETKMSENVSITESNKLHLSKSIDINTEDTKKQDSDKVFQEHSKNEVNKLQSNQNKTESMLQQAAEKDITNNKKPQSLAERLKFAKQSRPSKGKADSTRTETEYPVVSSQPKDDDNVLSDNQKPSYNEDKMNLETRETKDGDKQESVLPDKIFHPVYLTPEEENKSKQKPSCSSQDNISLQNQQNITNLSQTESDIKSSASDLYLASQGESNINEHLNLAAEMRSDKEQDSFHTISDNQENQVKEFSDNKVNITEENQDNSVQSGKYEEETLLDNRSELVKDTEGNHITQLLQPFESNSDATTEISKINTNSVDIKATSEAKIIDLRSNTLFNIESSENNANLDNKVPFETKTKQEIPFNTEAFKNTLDTVINEIEISEIKQEISEVDRNSQTISSGNETVSGTRIDNSLEHPKPFEKATELLQNTKESSESLDNKNDGHKVSQNAFECITNNDNNQMADINQTFEKTEVKPEIQENLSVQVSNTPTISENKNNEFQDKPSDQLAASTADNSTDVPLKKVDDQISMPSLEIDTKIISINDASNADNLLKVLITESPSSQIDVNTDKVVEYHVQEPEVKTENQDISNIISTESKSVDGEVKMEDKTDKERISALENKLQTDIEMTEINASTSSLIQQSNEQAQKTAADSMAKTLENTAKVNSTKALNYNESKLEDQNSGTEKSMVNTEIPEQNNAKQSTDLISKEVITPTEAKHIDNSQLPVVGKKMSGGTNDTDSRIIERPETSSEVSSISTNAIQSPENNVTVISETVKKIPSTSSITDDSKPGKLKFTKFGYLKKSQDQIKGDSLSQNRNKDPAIKTLGKVHAIASKFSAENGNKPGISGIFSRSKSLDYSSVKNIPEINENKISFSNETLNKEQTEDQIKSENVISAVDTKLQCNKTEIATNAEEIKVQSTEQGKDLTNLQKPCEIPTEQAELIEEPQSTEVVVETTHISIPPTAITETEQSPSILENEQKVLSSDEISQNLSSDANINADSFVENRQEPSITNEILGSKNSSTDEAQVSSSTSTSASTSNEKMSDLRTDSASGVSTNITEMKSEEQEDITPKSLTASEQNDQHSNFIPDVPTSINNETLNISNRRSSFKSILEKRAENTLDAEDSDDVDDQSSDESRPSSVTPPNPIDLLRSRFEGLSGIPTGTSIRPPVRPQSPFRRMSFNSRKQVIALEKIRHTTEKPWFQQKTVEPVKITYPKRSIKQQLEMERKVRKMVADKKCRTYKKAEIVVQLMDMNFEEEEAIQAAHECSTLEQAVSYLQQECLLCTGYFPVSQIVSMTHCEHRACRECIRAYFTVQIRDRTILDLLCPFCNEPDIGDEDVAQDYFNHLDIMLKKLVDVEIHELFQRKLRDRVLMKDPNFRWCSQCSSGFISMPNLKRLICPDCNAVTCASCRRVWEKEHQGISCEAFAALKDASDPEAQAAGLAKLLTEDGIDCPSCHFRYALAKGGCMHFRCIQCQHDFCSGCSRPFKMGQKCGVSEFCAKLGLHAHHPRNCLFYLRDKEPEDLQKLLNLNDIKFNLEPPEGMELTGKCQVMEQKETTDGMMDDYCGKEVQDGYAGLCRIHYVEYLGQLVNKHRVDPIQIFDNDDLELVLRRANIRLPPKRYRESDLQYREKLVNLIQEELPLDKTDGS